MKTLILLAVLLASRSLAYEVKPCKPRCPSGQTCDTKTGKCEPSGKDKPVA